MSFLLTDSPAAAGSNPATPIEDNSSTTPENVGVGLAPTHLAPDTPARLDPDTPARLDPDTPAPISTLAHSELAHCSAHPEAGVQVIENEMINVGSAPQPTVATGSNPATPSDENIPENTPQNEPNKLPETLAPQAPEGQPQLSPRQFRTPDQMFNRRHYVRPRKMGPLPDN